MLNYGSYFELLDFYFQANYTVYMNEIRDISVLEASLSYVFKDKSLLEKSLRHSSWVNEQPDEKLEDNERLEFLGDAVLNLIIGHLLMKMFPERNEGDLSRMRSNMVNEYQLANIARSINLGKFLLLGKGELRSHGRKKRSILSDAFEAIVAAVYLDGGFDKAAEIFENHFSDLLNSKEGLELDLDSKSTLQEFVQGTYKVMPRYNVIKETGPDHDKTFMVQLNVGDVETLGNGKSKKAAEQDAAAKALDILKKSDEEF